MKDCPCFKETSPGPSVNVNMELKVSQEGSDNYNSSQKIVINGKVESKVINHFSLRNSNLKASLFSGKEIMIR